MSKTKSLGAIIREETGRPVHILYVHGMSAEEAGGAVTFIAGLCKYAEVRCGAGVPAPLPRFPLGLGDRPTATYLQERVWRSEKEWEGGQPFVDRYVLPRDGKPPVVVDEINWWPLLAPLKCRKLVAPEAALSGIDKKKLALCHVEDEKNGHYPWLDNEAYATALKGPTISKGGVRLNSAVKRSLMNWGLADAVIALGPMRYYFRQAIEKALTYAAEYDGKGIDNQKFVIISASLGSFVVMDAATHPDTPHAADVVAATSNLYFFANQFALLELGRIGNVPASVEGASRPAMVPEPARDLGPLDMLSAWASGETSKRTLVDNQLRQIIAFSDPSDALTFNVPAIPVRKGDPPIVVNIYDRNGFNWFGFFKDPLRAHSGHSENPEVLKQMLSNGTPH